MRIWIFPLFRSRKKASEKDEKAILKRKRETVKIVTVSLSFY